MGDRLGGQRGFDVFAFLSPYYSAPFCTYVQSSILSRLVCGLDLSENDRTAAGEEAARLEGQLGAWHSKLSKVGVL